MSPYKRARAPPHNDGPREKGDLPPPTDRSGTPDEVPICPAKSERWSQQLLIHFRSCSPPRGAVRHRHQMYPLLQED